MNNDKLNIILESIALQNRPGPEKGTSFKDIDLVHLSFADLILLTSIFTEVFVGEVREFAEVLSERSKEFSKPDLSGEEKIIKETDLIGFFETNTRVITYLNDLNRLLISSDFDQNLLAQFNLAYNLPSYPGSYDAIKDQYLVNQAEEYAQGNDSATIQYLHKTENPAFLEARYFIKDVKSAILQTERTRLKKKLQFLDEKEAFDLSESEIKAAITLSERKSLKEIMRKIDAQEEKSKSTASIISIGGKFNWIKYAVAASIVGLIAITAILFNDKKPALADLVESATSDTSKTAPDEKQETTDLVTSEVDTTKMIITVRKEASLGFAVKPENIAVQIYTIKENADSLKLLSNTYTFKNNKLSIYLPNHREPLLYQIDNQYYLKHSGILYQIRFSETPSGLSKVTNRAILERIDRIDFQQDNE